MPYYEKEEMTALLEGKKYLQDKLYVNGFLISNSEFTINEQYPFFGNWAAARVRDYNFYVHKDTKFTSVVDGNATYFMLGHAVDPFDRLSEESAVLKKLAAAHRRGIDSYFKAQSDLTGVFCTGLIDDGVIYLSNDCAGMQIVYYGVVDGKLYFSSHSKLIADLIGLKQSDYIQRLVGSRFYHYMGTWLPGDLSPFPELRRLLPNHYVFAAAQGKLETIRFFPTEAIHEQPDEADYQKTIQWLSETLHETLRLYSEKWPEVSISVTGGRDSTTTLACANGLYDKFNYFSYISNEAERVDALAAKEICERIGLPHEIYEIPMEDCELSDMEAFTAVLECNAGCIGKNNPNDVRKRLYFIQNPKYDVEIKSWVNELGRGSQYVKYNKKKFPAKPTASYCRALHKIYVSPRLIHETDKVFRAYLKQYYANDVLKLAPWMELFWWEFCWSGGEGIFLTAEHRTSSEIAIPFNNRRYVARMLTVPLERRREDAIPKDIIHLMNPLIAKTGVVIKDLEHTDKRALLMRIYLEVFSHIHL